MSLWSKLSLLLLPSLALAQNGNYFIDADSLETAPLAGWINVQNLTPGKRRFCERRMHDLVDSLQENHSGKNKASLGAISFNNPPGTFGTGLCWWHSRFQRNATYLANYFPGKNPPSDKQAKKIIRAIATGRVVVEIPGFANLREFSSTYKSMIVKELNRMTMMDFPNLKVFDRFGDTSEMHRNEMWTMMNDIHQKMLQHPQLMFLRQKKDLHNFVSSHSVLLLKIEKVEEDTGAPWPHDKNIVGFDLTYVNSNSSGLLTKVPYKKGDLGIKDCPTKDGVGEQCYFTLRPDYQEDIHGLEQALADYCQ